VNNIEQHIRINNYNYSKYSFIQEFEGGKKRIKHKKGPKNSPFPTGHGMSLLSLSLFGPVGFLRSPGSDLRHGYHCGTAHGLVPVVQPAVSKVYHAFHEYKIFLGGSSGLVNSLQPQLVFVP